MSKNAAAREYLDYFLDLPKGRDPDFAVMLEGPWGSGKSFFVDSYFVDRLAKLRANDPDAKEEIRLTLFGVRELGDITSQIFAKVHPMLGGKFTKFVNVIGSKAASYVGVSTSPEENAKLLQEMILNLDGRVLVFDDFERCPLPVVEVMGFINRFVERDKVKVIVIASEEEIDENQIQEYRRRKEKLVGKTIRVGSDPRVVFDAFTASLTMPEARAAVIENRDAALTTFAACGRPNFRSLRAILVDYDRLVTLANPKLAASADALGALLLYMIAVGMEYRGGGIDADGLRNLSTDMAFRLNLNKTPVPEEQQRAQGLRAKYQLVSWRDPVVSPEMLAELFGSGTIEVSTLNQYLLSHPRVVGRAKVPAWRAMWSWYDMGLTEYRPMRDALAHQLAKRMLVHPGEILHAAGTSIRLQGYDDDVLDGVKLKPFFKAYLADLEKADSLLAVPQIFERGTGGYGGLVYNEHDNKAFTEIHELVRAATMRALSRRTQREAVDLLKRLQENPNDGSMLREWGFEEKKYAGIPILHNILVSDMADVLVVDSKLNASLLATLTARYEQTGMDNSLDPEKRWVVALHTELKKRLRLINPPYRSWGEIQLASWFGRLENWVTPRQKPATAKATGAASTGP